MSLFHLSSWFTSKIVTNEDVNFSRIKTDQTRTGLLTGHQFRMIRKIETPITYKFVSPVNFVLLSQNLSITDGAFEYYAWRAVSVTESTAFAVPVNIIRKNAVNLDYTMQSTIFSGGTLTINSPQDYVDYISLETSNASGHRESLSGPSGSERILPAGTYYLQFTGTADASIALEWEEIP